MTTPPAAIPVVDIRAGGPVRRAVDGADRARALRDECVAWLSPPAVRMLPGIDAVTRRWLHRSASPYVGEIAAIATTLGYPGIWFLNGCYEWGCSALAREQAGAPWLARTLDWPFPGLGRYLEIARMQGPAGTFDNVGWPGYAGVLTASAPGRFAAAINQAPLRRRTRHPWLRPYDMALNAARTWRIRFIPPDHLLRNVFETCASYGEARHRLETTPIARPVIYSLVGCASRRALRDRTHRGRLHHQGRQRVRRERLVRGQALLGGAHARRPDVHAHLRGDRGQQPSPAASTSKIGRDSFRTVVSTGSRRRSSIRTRGWRSRCVRPKASCARSATNAIPAANCRTP